MTSGFRYKFLETKTDHLEHRGLQVVKKALALEEERIATSPFFTSAASLAALVKNLDLLEMIMNEKLDI